MAKDLWIRDAAHDHVAFEGEDAALVRKLLACPEVQRLRRIRQLGFSSVTYPGAEHTRFAHAVGAAYICRLALDKLRERGLRFGVRQRRAMIAAALLHDVGHGPFSHATETALGHSIANLRKHEDWTQEIIGGDTAVRQVLMSYGNYLPRLVMMLLRGSPELGSTEQALRGLLSGNLDVDRLDFLMRDSVHTGLKTGLVDVPRLLDGLTVWQGSRIVVLEKNITTIEEFLIARHFMYQKVYFHKTTRGMEAVYRSWLRRAQDLDSEGRLPEEIAASPLGRLLRGEAGLADFLALDDNEVVVAAKWTKQWRGDRTLSRLADALVCRKPFKVVAEWVKAPGPMDRLAEAGRYLDDAGYPSQYFLVVDGSSEVGYDLVPYWEDTQTEDATRIEVLRGTHVEDISNCSAVVRTLMDVTACARIYAPHARRGKVEGFLRGS